MEVELTIDELKEIAVLYRKVADYYFHSLGYAEDQGEFDYYARRKEENTEKYLKFWKLYEKACEEIGELPF